MKQHRNFDDRPELKQEAALPDDILKKAAFFKEDFHQIMRSSMYPQTIQHAA